jgi:hypothetical protein
VTTVAHLDVEWSLEAIAAQRNVAHRDCRSCPHFEGQGDGLAYGWCRAHGQYAKLYHPPGGFFSQCQFKALARERTA